MSRLEANSATRSIRCEKRRRSSLASTRSLRSRSEMSLKTLSPPLSAVRHNIVERFRPQSRSNSRRSRHRRRMSTRPAKNTSRIASVSTLTPPRVPLSRARTSSALQSNLNVRSRRSRRMNVNMPTLHAPCRNRSTSGRTTGGNSVTVARTSKRIAWSSRRTISGSMPTPFPLSASLMTRYVVATLGSHPDQI